MKISIVGTGYVGLVTGACLAERGHQVVCLDVDQAKVTEVNSAIPPIYEVGLEDLLQHNVPTRLTATTDLPTSVIDTDITLLAVPTPYHGNGIDLSFIREAARQVGTALRAKHSYHLVAVKSTVVPGTTDEVVTPILEEASGKKSGLEFGVGMNPEFLTEGEAIHDFMFPDRIILGGGDERSIDTLAQLYSDFENVDRIRTSNRTAEMIKYTSNALLATMISFSNEIAGLCVGGVDVADVLAGVHASRYLRPILPDGTRVVAPITAFLWAGCGFGGSCLPKDLKALIAHGKLAGKPMPLLEAVAGINETQPLQLLLLLRRRFPDLKGVRVAILGLAFRPGTDDMRESPAIPVIRGLLAAGAQVKAYDPAANHEAEKLFTKDPVSLCDKLRDAITDVDAVVLVTRWEEFRRVPELLAHMDPPPVFIDGRRMLDKHGIARYEGIGL